MKPKVLIIDDEQEIGNLLSAVLGSMGFKAEYRSDLQSGLSAFEESKHDVVFLDLRLPDGEGFSIVPQIKAAKADANIIIISAHGAIEEKAKASSMGIKSYLQKPFNRGQIQLALEN